MKLSFLCPAAARHFLAGLFYFAAFVSFPAWAQDDADQLELGKKLFIQTAVPACAVCHTLKDAGASGAIGPVLDELKPDAQRVAKALRNGIGQMPSYRASLSEAQILALAQYVSRASGAKN